MQAWREALPFFQDGSYEQIQEKLEAARGEGMDILPPAPDILKAYDTLSPDQVKVVILGQDPYPTPGHAHGLSFSVQDHVRPFPRSLNNIFKELEADLGIGKPETGNLEQWMQQGVMLLNTTLTVEAGNAGAHAKWGWGKLTDQTIQYLSDHCENIVFVLWGGHARKKADLIDASRHMILESAHPSPLSASRGFFGSKPFSRINDYLESKGRTAIDWGNGANQPEPRQAQLELG